MLVKKLFSLVYAVYTVISSFVVYYYVILKSKGLRRHCMPRACKNDSLSHSSKMRQSRVDDGEKKREKMNKRKRKSDKKSPNHMIRALLDYLSYRPFLYECNLKTRALGDAHSIKRSLRNAQIDQRYSAL